MKRLQNLRWRRKKNESQGEELKDEEPQWEVIDGNEAEEFGAEEFDADKGMRMVFIFSLFYL